MDTSPIKPLDAMHTSMIQNSVILDNPMHGDLKTDPFLVHMDQDYFTMNQGGLFPGERQSGYPKPELYNQHYINKYSFPKGLVAMRKPEEMKKRNERMSLYDLETPAVRKGISGWKLTKRPMAVENPQEQLSVFPGMNESSILDSSVNNSQMKRKKSKSKKRRGGSHRPEVTIDGRKI
jgi:hypothetical protein